jgi:hypothetical protein
MDNHFSNDAKQVATASSAVIQLAGELTLTARLNHPG